MFGECSLPLIFNAKLQIIIYIGKSFIGNFVVSK